MNEFDILNKLNTLNKLNELIKLNEYDEIDPNGLRRRNINSIKFFDL